MPGAGDLIQEIESHITFYLQCANRDSIAEDVNQKMEGHMTFYLESNHHDSRSDTENQKIECHTTFYLDDKLRIRLASAGSYDLERITFRGEGSLNE
jgi:hypothetical protein